ncbi:hypothetical protein SAMN04488053_102251 [Alkalicoccus daliensis]|uniref:Cytochrome c oxidase subunit 4 n=2 Tax=Alkalicoccus daliensis TaxID=745820 RepID=A0A1H0CVY5_9BACI|nr:hypothetical protein SAMN04488053_102251 [Alkalicoccus daliensis]
MGYLNVASFLLGLFAWALPFLNLIRDPHTRQSKWGMTALLSLSACAVALLLQIFYNLHLVEIQDWAALEDTMGGVAFVSAVLLSITLILNFLPLLLRSRGLRQ